MSRGSRTGGPSSAFVTRSLCVRCSWLSQAVQCSGHSYSGNHSHINDLTENGYEDENRHKLRIVNKYSLVVLNIQRQFHGC